MDTSSASQLATLACIWTLALAAAGCSELTGVRADTCAPADPLPETVLTGPIAFTDVAVVDVVAGRLLADQAVLVRDGRIERIGPMETVAIPSDAVTIDGRCRFLVPGLADMHVHVRTTEELLVYLANGVTFVRVMWGSPALLQIRDEIEAGERLGPAMYVGTPGFDGAEPIWASSIVVAGPEDARETVAHYQSLGYDFLKVYEKLSPEIYLALAEAANQLDFPFAGHNPAPTGIDRVLASGQRSVEHFTNLQQHLGTGSTTPPWWDRPMSPTKMRTMAGRFRDAGVWSVPTLGIMTVDFTPAELAAHLASPEAASFPPRLFDIWAAEGLWLNPGRGRAGLPNQLQLLRTMAAEHAPLMVGTDAGFNYILAGFSMHEEMGRWTAAGIPPATVLAAATVRPAEFLERSEDFGRIEEGLWADLLLVDENPLADIAALERRAGVMVRGAWYGQDHLWGLVRQQISPGPARQPVSPGPARLRLTF